MMTAEQIVQCVDFLTACWPWAEWSDQTVAQWCDSLATVDLDWARFVSKRARDTLDRPPSIAWFHEQVRLERKAAEPAMRAIDAPPVDQEGVAELVAATRRMIAESKAKGPHNHKGPKPCSVCGGLVGTFGDQRGLTASTRGDL